MDLNVSYTISGLHEPATIVEMVGSVYFTKNICDRYFAIDKAAIENGRLCVYFSPRNLPNRLNRPAQHYVKFEPGNSVGLTIRKCVPFEDDSAVHVVYYCVESMFTPAQGNYFRFRRYEANFNQPYNDKILYGMSGINFAEKGFVCTNEYDDDGEGEMVFYKR